MFYFYFYFLFLGLVSGHPQCLDYQPPFRPEKQLSLCSDYKSFSCCNDEDAIESEYNEIRDTLSLSDNSTCSSYIKSILCQRCSPYAAHLYFAETTLMARDFPSLCPDYYSAFVRECGTLVQNIPSLRPIKEFDPNYCYPDILKDTTRNTGLGQSNVRGSCLQLCVKEVINDLYNPTSAKPANDGTRRLFVVEQRGVVWVYLANFTKLSPPFIDIRTNVYESGRQSDERGLLDIAFHPDFSANGLFYLYYTSRTNNRHVVRISEFRLSDNDMNRGNVSSERRIIEISQPYANHNGGPLLFLGGYLMIFTGDGGSANDPFGYAQNKGSLLGKALRINVDSYDASQGQAYTIPEDNPFVSTPGARGEIYAYGLRNPWRCTLDRGHPETGAGRDRIFCGDVGQGAVEEVDIIVPGGNYGWNGYEGNNCFRDCKRIVNHARPINTYTHSVGESITGGYVYRGCQSPNLQGRYIFGDWDNGRLFFLQEGDDGVWRRTNICMGGDSLCINGGLGSDYARYINTFAEDEAGEVYILSATVSISGSRVGRMYRLVDPSRRGNPSDCRRLPTREVTFEPTTTFTPYQSTQDARIEIRLVHPRKFRRFGRVEIRRPGDEWGGICVRRLGRREGRVICRQLGFSGVIWVRYRSNFGRGTGRFWLDNVVCRGTEKSIFACSHRGWGVASCNLAASVGCWRARA